MLVFAGISHAQAPLAVRERCSVQPEERASVRAAVARRLGPVVLLSTCGRAEVYAAALDAEAERVRHAAAAWLTDRAGAGSDAFVETATGLDALRRLVRVACGLESALEGEDEILGQLRRAWLDAELDGGLPPALHAACRLAVQTGRRARRIGDTSAWTSLADAAAAHVALAVEVLPAPRVLIAGSGPMGVRAARTLRDHLGGRLALAMAGRTPARVERHAHELDGRPLTLGDLPLAFAWADAAIVGLRTARPLIGAAQIAPRVADRPLCIVDLSLPRAVESAVAGLPGVTLRNVDDLGATAGRLSRWDEAARVRVGCLVDEAVADYRARVSGSDAAATLTALRLRADGTRRALLARTLRRFPDLDDEARRAVEAMSRALVNRLLHDPTVRLRSDGDGSVARQVQEMFGL